MSDIEHEYTEEIVCPYCGYNFSDSWELGDDEGEAQCGECDKEFYYIRNITIDYCTSEKER